MSDMAFLGIYSENEVKRSDIDFLSKNPEIVRLLVNYYLRQQGRSMDRSSVQIDFDTPFDDYAPTLPAIGLLLYDVGATEWIIDGR
jgi:hypothetical protein